MGKKSPEWHARNRKRMKLRYDERKAARRCVRCNAGLPDGRRVVYCVECEESRAAWGQEHKVERRPKKAANQRARYARDPKAAAAAKKAEREARVLRGQCYFCTDDALPDSNFCAHHLKVTRDKAREAARKRTGFYERYPHVKPGEVIHQRDRVRLPSSSPDPSTPPDESAPASDSLSPRPPRA